MALVRTWFATLFVFLFAGIAAAAPFTPGNVVIYRVGTGVPATLVATGNPVFLDEYSPSGALVQSIPLPSAAAGPQKALLASGTAVTDGLVTRSANGNCLAVPGYGRDLNTGAGNLATTGTQADTSPIPRIVGRVTATGAIDTSTALTDFSFQSNYRGAASTNCIDFWVAGAAAAVNTTPGVHYATLGSTTSTDLTSATFNDARGVAIYDGQLYASSNLGTNTFKGVSTVGIGAPTSGSPAVTRLPGLADTGGGNTFAFFLADLSAAVSGVDTLYVADGTSGLRKYSLVAGTWSLRGTYGLPADAYRGVTGIVNGGVVTLYATRKGGSTATGGGELVKIVDLSGYDVFGNEAPDLLATAAANTAFRGVALAPEVTVTPVSAANGTIFPDTPQVVAGGTGVPFTITPDPTYSVVVGGTCGGTLVGNTYTTAPATANCTVIPTFTQTPTYLVTPVDDPHSTIDPDTPQGVLSGSTITFTVTADPGYTVTVGGTCGGTLVGNMFTTDPVVADCTVAPVSTLVTYVVTPGSDPNGTIAPDTPQTIVSGQTTAFVLAPAPGYFSASVGGTCGGTLLGNNFTTNPVIADCSVLPNFAPLPSYTVTPSVIGHGTISPDTPQTIVSGNKATFTLTAEAGYTAVVRGTCGGTLTSNSYQTNAVTANCTVVATFSKKLVLFVGNSFTFGRVDPVMSYNTANVTDLTYAMWLANSANSNPDEPHPWGGIPGVFKKLTDQAGLDFDVSISARNAASLRGQYLNTNPDGWDLRGNVASQKWDIVVLQDLSDEPMPFGRASNANLPYFDAYADKFEQWVHVGGAETYTESQLFGGTTATCMDITHATANACETVRTVAPANANASATADVYLYSTWARPDMIGPNGTNPAPGGTYYTAAEGLEAMTLDLHNGYFGRAAANANYKAVNPVGDAFLLAVQTGVAMRDPYAPEAGKINLWHTDFFHPSKYGSYLSALVHFAMITGLDPTTLGMGELAAVDLGIAPADAAALQQVAKASVVPKAPAIGTATASNGQVTVSFTAPGNVGGLAIIGYVATCGTFSAPGTVSPIAVTVPNGTAVTCTVAAANSVGTGASSAPSGSVTPVTVPGAPTNVVATPGTGSATFNFDPPAFDGGSPILSYVVTCAPPMGQGNPVDHPGPTPPVVFAGLTGGVEYTCTVRAINAAGPGAISAPVIVTPLLPQFMLTAATNGDGQGSIVSVPAGIDCGLDCSESFAQGTSVVLTATPGANSTFIAWTGCDSVSTNQCTVSVTAARTVTATFNFVSDTTPDAFVFTDQANVNPGAILTSNAITVSGINSAAAISVTGGSYSIGCTGTFVTTAANVAAGSTVCVRHTAPLALGAATDTTLTIGGVSDTFTSTTLANLPPNGDFDGDGIPNGVENTEALNPLVKDNDIFTSDRLFVMQQYRDFLGREGDPGGIQFYQNQLGFRTATRGQVIENFLNSPEFSGVFSPVTRLYFATFLRTPDYDGLLFQVNVARGGASLAAIANNFTLSPEFQSRYGTLDNAQYVSLLYQNILARTPVQSEIDFHVNRLVNGATRGEVLIGFSESPEYLQAIGNEVFVTVVYVGMLRRAPEPAGLAYWVDFLDLGNPGANLITGFLQAPEYHDRFLP